MYVPLGTQPLNFLFTYSSHHLEIRIETQIFIRQLVTAILLLHEVSLLENSQPIFLAVFLEQQEDLLTLTSGAPHEV